VAPVDVPKLESETKDGLWKTSSISIKDMREVNYGNENMHDEMVERNGKIVYIEKPIEGASVSIILKKKITWYCAGFLKN